jgi:hypothetical protein
VRIDLAIGRSVLLGLMARGFGTICSDCVREFKSEG